MSNRRHPLRLRRPNRKQPKQIKLLKEAAQRLYKEWFVDLRFYGNETARFVDGVPEGWRLETIGNLIKKVARTEQIKTSDYLHEGKYPVIDQSREFIAGYTDKEDAVIRSDIPAIVFGDHTRIVKYIQFPCFLLPRERTGRS